MEKWLSISQLSEVVETPETTVRRYLNKFSKYFRHEQIGRGKKYHPEAIEILNRIALLYNEDYETTEIEDLLSKEFAFTVDDEPGSEHEDSKNKTTTQPPMENMEKQFEEFKNQQEQFNRQLLQRLDEQQSYIQNSIEERDKKLMDGLREVQETKKLLASTKQKRWWEFWK